LIGTLGALIRIKSRIPTKQQTFDIGIAGPLAGFIAAVRGGSGTGFANNCRHREYIFSFHPEYERFRPRLRAACLLAAAHGSQHESTWVIGKNLLFYLF